MTATTSVRPHKSTTVRFFPSGPAIRAAFPVLDRLAPGLAARWAEHIWFTLPRPVTPAGSIAVPGGHPFTVDAGGSRIVGAAWGTGPAVYLMHGWAGNAGQLRAFIEPLTGLGFRVVAFDAPSHGRSGPGGFGARSSSITEFAAALTAVVAAHGPAHAIIAHSMGGAATAVALCDGLHAERIVLVAPMASPESYARQLGAALGFGAATHRRLIARIERRVGAPMHHFNVPELGRAVAMPPTLVVHDRTDTFAPVSDGAAIAAAWPSARLHVTDGLGHGRLLRDSGVVAEIVGFVAPGKEFNTC